MRTTQAVKRRASLRSQQAVYGNKFRAQRLAPFLEIADAVLAERKVCRVLDIGGEKAYWDGLRDAWRGRTLDITIVNIEHATGTDGEFTYRQGDARDLSQFPDASFDIVHSNSVIEHVGSWSDMQAMAAEVRRLAPAYFVQTPNFWFPLEPHLRTPFIHWLPHPWRRRIVMARACGFYPRARTVAEAHKILSDASLIDAAAMAALFPYARIIRERFGFLTKSLVAVRTERGRQSSLESPCPLR